MFWCRNEDVREKAARDLRDYVSAVSREPSGGVVTFNNDINRRIFELVQSNDSSERLGGIMAIDKLIDLRTDSNDTQITRFVNYLRAVLPGNDAQAVQLAAKAMGKLATSSSSLVTDLVEFEIRRALEWLQGDRHEARRYSAVLVLRELARNSTTIIYSHISEVLDLMWVALRDIRVTIREAAAEALRACLDIIYTRESHRRADHYNKLLLEAQNGLKMGTVECIHGSFLTYKELLHGAGMFMRDRYREVCDVILYYKDHRDALIRRSVISLIPTLAEYNPSEFVASRLHKCMLHLIGQLKKERDRSAAFIAIGEVALAVGSNMESYLDPVIQNIRDGLQLKGKNRTSQEVPIFLCIGMLAKAVGQSIVKYMQDLLDLMFACSLSRPFVQTLDDVGHAVPPLLPQIQERLLDMLSVILSGQPFRVPGSPENFMTITPLVAREIRDAQALENRDTETLILALDTLGSFDFKNHALCEFVKDCAVTYLEQDEPGVRKSAALTCSKILANDHIVNQTANHAIAVVNEVLEKLLTVGIADPDPTIRYIVLKSLVDKFDRHLSQAENVRSLFIALNDEVFVIRELAISIIGRLTSHNPACVMPSLRKTLIQLLTELQYSGASRSKEESAILLSLLVRAAQTLFRPYIEPMMKVLLPKACDSAPTVATSVITCIGELAQIGGSDMVPYHKDLVPLIIETLRDQSLPAKREAALRTLSHLAGNSGYVMDPYLDYPELLDILLAITQYEQNPSIRRETVKLIGVLGAIDPYRHHQRGVQHAAEHKITSSDVSLIMSGLGPSSEEFYPTVVVNTLMGILRDPSLGNHHTDVIQAIMYIFKTLGLKCVTFLPQIIPGFLSVMRSCGSSMLEFYFQQLGILISIVKQHIRNFLDDIFQLIQEFWFTGGNLIATILTLVESIARALEGEFKIYLPKLLPNLLAVFDNDPSPGRLATQKTLHALITFGSNIEEYMHLVLPAVVKMFEKLDAPVAIRRCAIQTVAQLSRKVNFADHVSRIVHPLSRVLTTGNHELRMAAMDTLCALVFQLGNDYAIFIPMIAKCLNQNKISHPNYELLVSKLLKGESLPQDLTSDESYIDSRIDEASSAEATSKKLPVNQQHLKTAWEASQRSTKEDWQEWFRRLSVELLKESPSHALRACATLAGSYNQLAKELFNAAFYSCWAELYDQYQDEFVRALETALHATQIPPEILQMLLNLAEFMEHDDKALPIDIRTLGSYAAKCHAYAKALHYKELEFITEPTTSTIENLIAVNNHLQQFDAAIGTLTYAQQHHNLELKESWYERLHRWEDALVAYERRAQEDPSSTDAVLGKMRCLHALGEWDLLSQLAQEKWLLATPDVKRSIAQLAVAAAWGLGNWDKVDDYISVIKQDSPDCAFFRAILALHQEEFVSASSYIATARNLLDTELTALVGESYNRAYGVAVRIQMLAELDEIIAYKKAKDQPEKKAIIQLTWSKRLEGIQRDVDTWQRMLKLRSLVISPKENMDAWIKFANLCRKSGRLGLTEKSLNSLLDEDEQIDDFHTITKAPSQVVYAHLKYLWATGRRDEAFSHLCDFTAKMSQNLGVSIIQDAPPYAAPAIISQRHPSSSDQTRLLARCYLKQGEWHIALTRNWTTGDHAEDILRSYRLATHFDDSWYKAWHAWALANYEVVAEQDKNGDLDYNAHIVPSVNGFFRSIALSAGNALQDTLRLLTLWFDHGFHPDVLAALNQGFSTVSIDTWLEVIPQLIARIHAQHGVVRRTIHQLLSEVGRAHPQALVYPLTVATKSQSKARRSAAMAVVDKLREHSATLVDQALLVSHELIRVAILWHEQWHEGLEEASRLYFTDHNIQAMFDILKPLHDMLDKGPETLREVSFNQTYGRDLQEARDWCIRYERTLELADLNQAWDLYYQVFRKISKQLPSLTTLELQFVSQKLLKATDLDLAMPGTYVSGKPIVKIAGFAPTFTVITSKQRPRKLTIKGSDGHEDIRQDERVMQLFGLVNTLLSNDSECYKRHLSIQQYPVIPLSQYSGLLGWVPDSDTLHVLIKDYRETRKILLNIEHRLMLQMAPDYDNLTLLQKVEVFEYALDNTTGQDLYRVLWLKSRSSEAWLDRRSNYTRSLATMSMVGYILGLGDRHPSNLMLDRYTGKVIHIDFGDCFEVAMNREKFPEKIPFRLTRMLTNAMEISGIEGSFRITAEAVMRVLRDNKESLMAVLEAFVYDPLLNWRLITNPSPIDGDRRRSDDLVDERGLGRRSRADENELVQREVHQMPEMLNQRAVIVMKRVADKLQGTDFKDNEELDVPQQDVDNSFVDSEIRTRISNVVSAIGGFNHADESCPYVLGDDALNCLKDLKKWLRGHDDRLGVWDAARCMAEAQMVQNDICPTLSLWDESSSSDRQKSRLALACVELLVPLTWPLDLDSEQATENQYFHLPHLRLAQINYKHAILSNNPANLLRHISRVAFPSMVVNRRNRTERDDGIIRLVLYVIRNLAIIEATIEAFEKARVFDMLCTLGSSMGEDFEKEDIIIIETLFHLIKGIKPEALYRNTRRADSTLKPISDLSNMLKRENDLKRLNARNAPTRHNRFGTLISVVTRDEKRFTVSSQSGLTDTHSTLDKLDKAKKFRAPKHRTKEQRLPEDVDLENVPIIMPGVIPILRNFVDQFMDYAFNPLLKSIRSALEREAARTLRIHRTHYCFVVSFFLLCFRLRNLEVENKTILSEDADYGLVATVLDRHAFILSIKLMREALEEKRWTELQCAMQCFKEVLRTIDSMTFSSNPEYQEIADNMQMNLFDDESTLDLVVQILKAYKAQPLGYLDACTDLTHYFLKILEKYSSSKSHFFIRSKRRQQKKPRKSSNNPTEGSDEEANGEQSKSVFVQREFDFKRYEAKFASESCIKTFQAFLEYYAELSPEQIKRPIIFFHRIFVKRGQEALMFRLDFCELLYRVVGDKAGFPSSNPARKEVEKFEQHYVKKLVGNLSNSPALITELLFSKSRSDLYFLQHGYDRTVQSRAPRHPAELEVRPSVPEEQQLAVAIAVLIELNKNDILDWLKGVLSRAKAERLNWESAAAAQKLLDNETTDLNPGVNLVQLPPFIQITPETDEQKQLIFQDARLCLLLKCLGMKRLGLDDDIDAMWIIPSEMSSERIDDKMISLKQYTDNPPEFEDGKTAEDLIRRKPQAREYDTNSEVDYPLHRSGVEEFEADDPIHYKSNKYEHVKPPRKRAKRKSFDDVEADVRRRKKEEEKISAIKSSKYVRDSDEDSDAEADLEFFRREEQLRKRIASYGAIPANQTETTMDQDDISDLDIEIEGVISTQQLTQQKTKGKRIILSDSESE
ncbi:Phosphatidylinositol 3-kinase tor2 [Neolecta irregularis DAH-3]|uniref:non-specific serine/threonine protein kinase n=1 Tax=Neolecta irregularis (strain DAH-3) TaxID=1198029 RepID=A0A1U7LUH6_NEOID|nr:Phosphatidylinositol 3-kinase tor2 [Neolecta irregularis DAH-3]|eukprot:OLL26279.1 Phosphatidylinositol 3-kinase tor2 [Neolecta irregularis DAH-3]